MSRRLPATSDHTPVKLSFMGQGAEQLVLPFLVAVAAGGMSQSRLQFLSPFVESPEITAIYYSFHVLFHYPYITPIYSLMPYYNPPDLAFYNVVALLSESLCGKDSTTTSSMAEHAREVGNKYFKVSPGTGGFRVQV